MTTETYGVEGIKQAVGVAIGFAIQAAKTVKGKFKLIYVLAFIDEARGLAEVIANKDQIIAEIKDLTPAERVEIVAHIKDEFDIPDDKVEVFAENALTWAEATFTLFKESKEVFGKK